MPGGIRNLVIEEFGNWVIRFQSLNYKITQLRNWLQSSFKQRRSNGQRDEGKKGKINHVRNNGAQSGFFQQQRLEAVDGIGERVGLSDRPQPPGEGLDRVDGSAGEEQQRIEDAENGARH